ncbi:MAG TPA: hypothetical protein VHW64_13615 [Nocardioides sp.]|jgi:hypothetical protein|uniref:hypothetical protein n=1 Tax=Nocardioides sp. TaxID=35761 RepID=UPI002E3790F2|nr:hypothetical protein [Nocardioides sp.]HEX3931738.1 hypothetical protein [Nocardioides sp.]
MDDEHAEANPGTAVEEAVRRALGLVDTWIGWDRRPRVSQDGDRIYTPGKAVRRIADHLVDHLAEVEAVLAGAASQPDQWHGSLVTLESDWARFTELDRDEAHQRLPRLARTFALRLAAAGPQEWDRPREGWSLREIADHLTGVLWYAEQVGDLTPTAPADAGSE